MFGILESKENKNLILMASLVSMLVVNAIVTTGRVGRFFIGTMFILVLLEAIWALSASRTSVRIALALGIPASILSWLTKTGVYTLSVLISDLFTVAFLVFTCITMLRYVSRGGKITTDKLYSAVNVYLMIGLTWSCFYHIAELLQPGSYLIGGEISSYSDGLWSHLIYFSYVTLTTLGFGEITPVQPLSRVLSMLEAVCGVLFVAFFVARLVGKYGSDRPETPTD